MAQFHCGHTMLDTLFYNVGSKRMDLIAPRTWLATACARMSAEHFLSFLCTSTAPYVKEEATQNYPLAHSLSYAAQGNHLIPCCQRVTFRVYTSVSKMQKSGSKLSLTRCLSSMQRGELTLSTNLQRVMELWKEWRPLPRITSSNTVL